MGSFSININNIMSYAADMFNALIPIASVGIGLTLGVGVLGLLVRTVKGALSGM